jgi:hypothetical protein
MSSGGAALKISKMKDSMLTLNSLYRIFRALYPTSTVPPNSTKSSLAG